MRCLLRGDIDEMFHGATLLMRHRGRDTSSLLANGLISSRYRFIYVQRKSKGIESRRVVGLERGETNQSTPRHNQFEYTRYMSWKALNTIHMIGSATPREIAIPVYTCNLLYPGD